MDSTRQTGFRSIQSLQIAPLQTAARDREWAGPGLPDLLSRWSCHAGAAASNQYRQFHHREHSALVLALAQRCPAPLWIVYTPTCVLLVYLFSVGTGASAARTLHACPCLNHHRYEYTGDHADHRKPTCYYPHLHLRLRLRRH